MVLYYNGSATIDDQMTLRKADESLYKFIGQNIYCSVSHFIHPEDFHRFQNALRELQNGLPRDFVVVRLKNGDNYDWCLTELTREPFDIDGKPLTHLSFSTLIEEEYYHDQLQKVNSELETCLNLLGCTLLSYDSQTDSLMIFENCDGQKIFLYQGTLKSWKKSLLSDKVDADYHNAFNTLCDEIETGKDTFRHNIMTNSLSEDGSMKLYTFKCQSITGKNSSHKVFGAITISDGTKKNVSDINSRMDAGLPVLNKAAITEYAKMAILSGSGSVHLIIVDLDNFKTINDTYGHMFGDEVLLKSSTVIKEAIGNTGVLGRIGGDEMMLVLTQIKSHAELRNILRSIRTGIDWAHKGIHSDLKVTCSMGIATYPEHGNSYDEIFQLADRMLYIAKNKGKNRYVIYTPEIHSVTPSLTLDSAESSAYESLQEDQTGVMRRLIEDFFVRRVVPYSVQLNEIGWGFKLDEIVMVYGDMKVSSTWNHKGVFDDIEGPEFLNPDPLLLQSFDKNNILAANGIFNLEGISPAFARLMTERGIKSALFYKMVRNGTMFGYIMFAKKNRGQMWSEYDKTLLASISKIIELSFKGNS